MAGAMKKVDKIRQIVRLKQLMMRWKHMSLRRGTTPFSHSDSSDCSESDPSSSTSSTSTSTCSPIRRAPPGFLAVYVGVGPERHRFVIPARFLNLVVFKGLLKMSEEEFGFQATGGLILPCEVSFFREILKRLKKDERRYGKFSLEEFVKMLSDQVGNSSDSCKETLIAFAPLLQKAKV